MRNVCFALEDYSNDRIDEIVNHIAAVSAEYKQLTQSVKIAHDQVLSGFTDAHKAWLEKYEELVGEREALIFRLLYRRAFQDGLKIGFLLSNTVTEDEGKKLE